MGVVDKLERTGKGQVEETKKKRSLKGRNNDSVSVRMIYGDQREF